MKRMKKIMVGICVFFSGILFKVLPVFSTTYYGAIIEKSVINEVSSTKESSKTLYDIITPIANILLPIILLIVGTIVIINKKMSNKTKILIMGITIAIIVLYILLITLL